MTASYISADGHIIIPKNNDERSHAFDEGYLVFAQAKNEKSLLMKLGPHITRVGDEIYLTKCMDKPFSNPSDLLEFVTTNHLLEVEK